MSALKGALEAAGAEIAGIVAGFRFEPDHNAVVDEWGFPVHVVHEEINDLIDWVPDHDFIPFTPGCGKVLAVETGSNIYPLYDHNGATFGVPYLAPFANVHKWASIPPENIESFSRECLLIARDLFEVLEELNSDSPLTVLRLIKSSSKQRVNVPVISPAPRVPGLTDSFTLPTTDVRVVEFIENFID